VLPGATDETISQLEQRISELKSITERLKEGETPEQLLTFLMGEDVEILHRESIQFACNCSREKSEAMLKALGKEELESILRELGQAEVICHFCNEKYLFSGSDLESLIASFNK
jgi:molecular chaperone Hsp33